jgi:hypothetical protein
MASRGEIVDQIAAGPRLSAGALAQRTALFVRGRCFVRFDGFLRVLIR